MIINTFYLFRILCFRLELRRPPDVISRGRYLYAFLVHFLAHSRHAVHKKGLFCGQSAEIEASVHEKRVFCGQDI